MEEQFRKYHALGNDYIVIDPAILRFQPLAQAVRRICDRNTGAGSDGILFGPLPPHPKAWTDSTEGSGEASGFISSDTLGMEPASFGLRIFNPDGSEAEKSGNGLRIFSLYLAEAAYVRAGENFFVRTPGGTVESIVESLDRPSILVDMGEPSFAAPGGGEFVLGSLDLGGESLLASYVSMGNPHCVIFVENPEPDLARRLGPLVERHPLFPNRTNVQFAKVLDTGTMRIEIWERGAGYTMASGSSSCAAAAVARRLGLVSGEVTVRMPGGELSLDLSRPSIRMRGPALQVYKAAFSPALSADLTRLGALESGRGA